MEILIQSHYSVLRISAKKTNYLVFLKQTQMSHLLLRDSATQKSQLLRGNLWKKTPISRTPLQKQTATSLPDQEYTCKMDTSLLKVQP